MSLIVILVQSGAVLLLLCLAEMIARGAVRPPARAPADAAALFVRHIIRPALILILSSLLWLAAMRGPNAWPWLAYPPVWVDGWFLFWWLLLGVETIEGAAVAFYRWRGRAFPIPGLLRNILRLLAVFGLALAVLRYAVGLQDIGPLLASTALVTAVIGFALQGVLGNLLAGMSLHLTRAVVPEDWVRVENVEGQVVATNWRETRIRGVDGHVHLVPNSVMAGAVVTHYTWPDNLRRHALAVGASYSDAPGAVIAALQAAAAAVPEVLAEPAAQALLTEYKDFGINYQLRFWTRQYQDRARIEGDVLRMIWYQFKRQGIEIPFPMSDKLLNDLVDVIDHQRRLPAEDGDVARNLDDFWNSEFLRTTLTGENGEPLLRREELAPVAALLQRRLYTAGEVLFRQGEGGESCHILVRGALRGAVAPAGGGEPIVFEVAPGGLVGEMSLLTGLPRSATVQVTAESEALDISRAALARLLALQPGLPERLAQLAAARAEQNTQLLADLDRQRAQQIRQAVRQETLLQRFLHLMRKP